MKRFYDRKGLQVFIGIVLFSILWLIAFVFSFEFEMLFSAEGLQELIWSLPDVIGASMILIISLCIMVISVISAVMGYKKLFVSSVLMVGIPVVSEILLSLLSSNEALGYLFMPVFLICYPFGMVCYAAIDSFTSCFGYFGDIPIPILENAFVPRGLLISGIVISLIVFCSAYEKPTEKKNDK